MSRDTPRGPPATPTAGGFEADLFAHLEALETDHFWFEARNRLLLGFLHRYFPQTRTLLEVGCGTGFVLAGIRAASPAIAIAGCDYFEEGLRVARRRVPGARLFVADARRLPCEAAFDVVGAFDVLEHIEEDAAVLAEMFRATRPRGGILLTVPQHPFLWSAMDRMAHHRRRYTRRELVAKVEGAGFRVVRCTSFVSLLLPAVLLARLAGRRAEGDLSTLPEFRIGRVTNSALSRLMSVERRLIAAGVSFPFGSSLFVAATRP